MVVTNTKKKIHLWYQSPVVLYIMPSDKSNSPVSTRKTSFMTISMWVLLVFIIVGVIAGIVVASVGVSMATQNCKEIDDLQDTSDQVALVVGKTVDRLALQGLTSDIIVGDSRVALDTAIIAQSKAKLIADILASETLMDDINSDAAVAIESGLTVAQQDLIIAEAAVQIVEDYDISSTTTLTAGRTAIDAAVVAQLVADFGTVTGGGAIDHTGATGVSSIAPTGTNEFVAATASGITHHGITSNTRVFSATFTVERSAAQPMTEFWFEYVLPTAEQTISHTNFQAFTFSTDVNLGSVAVTTVAGALRFTVTGAAASTAQTGTFATTVVYRTQ
jgi:hypothetical protein